VHERAGDPVGSRKLKAPFLRLNEGPSERTGTSAPDGGTIGRIQPNEVISDSPQVWIDPSGVLR